MWWWRVGCGMEISARMTSRLIVSFLTFARAHLYVVYIVVLRRQANLMCRFNLRLITFVPLNSD